MIAIDTETHLIQPGLLAPSLVCMSSAELIDGIPKGNIFSAKDATVEFGSYLLTQDLIVGHNIAYDLLVLLMHARKCSKRTYRLTLHFIFKKFEQDKFFDTMIATQLDCIAKGNLGRRPDGSPLEGKGYSLKECASIYLGIDTAKQNDKWRLRYAELSNVPLDKWEYEAYQYPIDDAVNTLKIANYQHTNKDVENLHDVPRQTYFAFCAHLGAAWGFRTDKEKLEKLKAETEDVRQKGALHLVSKGVLSPSYKRNMQVIKERVEKAFRENTPRTKTGGISTAADVLMESGDETLIELHHWQNLAKIETTYIPYIERGTRTALTPRVNPVVATGRASYRDPIQQFPRKGGVRECIAARPGRLFVSCDYSGLELATHGQSCLWILGHSKLVQVLNSKQDPHALMALNLMGETEFKADDKTHQNFRQIGKIANFGFPGGMGVAKFVVWMRSSKTITTTSKTGQVYPGLRFCIRLGDADECGISILEHENYITGGITRVCAECFRQATRLKNVWLETFPENKEYFMVIGETVNICREKGEDFWVNQHKSNRKRGKLNFSNGANTYFQGLAADGMKAAFCEVAKQCYVNRQSALYGSRPILSLHDEIIMETPEDVASNAAKELSRIMVHEMKQYTPDVFIKAEPCLMRFWDKNAKPTFDNHGNLIPYSS